MKREECFWVNKAKRESFKSCKNIKEEKSRDKGEYRISIQTKRIVKDIKEIIKNMVVSGKINKWVYNKVKLLIRKEEDFYTKEEGKRKKKKTFVG